MAAYLDFVPGNTSYVDCGSNGGFGPDSIDNLWDTLYHAGATLEMWVKPRGWGGWSGLWGPPGQGCAIISKHWGVYLSADDGTLYINHSGTIQDRESRVPFDDYIDNRWHHLAFTLHSDYDVPPGDDLWRIYIDGREANYIVQQRGSSLFSDAFESLVIGDHYAAQGLTFDGGIGWVRFSKAILYTGTFEPPDRCTIPTVNNDTVILLVTEGTGSTTYNLGFATADGTIYNSTWMDEPCCVVDPSVEVYGVELGEEGGDLITPMRGDRSAYDAMHFPELHTNDADAYDWSLHHSLGDLYFQAAKGDHTHIISADDLDTDAHPNGYALLADGAGGVTWGSLASGDFITIVDKVTGYIMGTYPATIDGFEDALNNADNNFLVFLPACDLTLEHNYHNDWSMYWDNQTVVGKSRHETILPGLDGVYTGATVANCTIRVKDNCWIYYCANISNWDIPDTRPVRFYNVSFEMDPATIAEDCGFEEVLNVEFVYTPITVEFYNCSFSIKGFAPSAGAGDRLYFEYRITPYVADEVTLKFYNCTFLDDEILTNGPNTAVGDLQVVDCQFPTQAMRELPVAIETTTDRSPWDHDHDGSFLTLMEADGSPSIINPSTIKVPSGKLADEGGGIAWLYVEGLPLTVEEVDGSPSVVDVSKIKVPSGTLTASGGGVVELILGGVPGESSLRVEEVGGTPSIAAVYTLQFPDDSLTDHGSGTVEVEWPVTDTGEGHITVFPNSYESVVGASWAMQTSTSSLYNWYIRNAASGVQNDALNFKVFLAAGTYSFMLVHHKSAAAGICTVNLDAVSQGTIDMYNGTTAWNTRSTITGIIVASSGLKTLQLLWATKNASSSAYTAYMVYLSLWRTA